MRIKVNPSINQVYFLGHINSTLGLLIFLTAGMPFGGRGRWGRLMETGD